MRQLSKIENEGKISGVCAGLGRYFNIDVTLIRLIWILAIFFGVGSPILIYIILAIILPSYDSRSEGYRDEYTPANYNQTNYNQTNYNPTNYQAVEKEEVEEDEYNTDERYK